MDQQKIDRLFREKLDSIEVMPSSQAWNEVQRKIGSKQSQAKFYWIAAAISAIILSWVVWPSSPAMELTPIVSEVNHPVLNPTPEWNISVPKKQVEIVKEDVKPNIINQPKTQLIAEAPIEKIIKENREEITELELAKQTAVVEVVDVEELNIDILEPEVVPEETVKTPIKVDLSKVKITYIASANTQEKKLEKDSLGAFKKFIALAGKISPGDVLADIKTAKDDFINGGFKSKQKDSRSL